MISTPRLLLREWRQSDLPAFAALNADPEVMACLLGTLERGESDSRARRVLEHFAAHGFGLWAAEVPGVAEFIGFIGLCYPAFQAHFTPCVEIGWRLARAYWGQGYATEGARGALAYGFRELPLDEIVSMTVPANGRSWRVMQRLGMTRSPQDDFDHPLLPAGHRLRRHVLYRLTRRDWAASNSGAACAPFSQEPSSP